MMTDVLHLEKVRLSPSLKKLVDTSRKLYQDHLATALNQQAWVTTAPGRVNLIGEHTDYTQGFVFPLAIEFSTVVYGTGSLTVQENKNPTKASLKFLSSNNRDRVEQVDIDVNTHPPESAGCWTWYVAGTIAEYLKDLPPQGTSLELSFAIAGDVPLGSGLSSSASLEVAVATFVECVLGEYAFQSETDKTASPAKIRAIRCQKAENIWCHSPCGIMDQYISSAGIEGSLLLIDCRTNDYEVIKQKEDPNNPVVLVVANSAVTHSIGGGEYPVRVQQCKDATAALQKKHGVRIQTLRDATAEDVLTTKGEMEDVIYRRARHVVTENARVLATKTALLKGDYKIVGQQMNLSHISMRDDYETSCEEIDLLVDLAQKYDGVYGSRLTGGGFGGCTVTLVAKDKAQGLIDHMQIEYIAKTGKDCTPFMTTPGPGARVLGVDTL